MASSLSPLQALYERCDRLRPSLFRLASDTMEDDAALAKILAANDELTLVVNSYKDQVGRGKCNGGREGSKSEEEVAGKNDGRPPLVNLFSSSSPCGKHFDLVFVWLLCEISDPASSFSSSSY